ncbi:1,3-beta-glucan synthase subunit FKS1, domain-1-domain-containing protein [Endogone sp. FLAS-F59071]|nr:1,3-beta-glucan synthase subunit FKS1, domain-1-domain-containing protein [Endogone sp. FLAS-F59071]|eukprot:RUS13489.1 1,3-beta-glucan synthase subunit FKS1, domain-1-domain-containing protein [Endogone sp. FLAS-F59071]
MCDVATSDVPPVPVNGAYPKGKRRDYPDVSESDSELFSNFTTPSEPARAPTSGILTDIGLFGATRGIEESRYKKSSPSADSLIDKKQQQQQQQHRTVSSSFTLVDESSSSTVPTIGDYSANAPPRQPEMWPSWVPERQVPVSREDIEEIFVELTDKFGFQQDSMRNMYEHLMTMLDSRASRMIPIQALVMLHADYIGGENANYRKWYFAAQLDLDDAVGDRNVTGLGSRSTSAAIPPRHSNESTEPELTENLEKAEARWRDRMNEMPHYEKVRQLALYLLIWGEAATLRFTPECLCFIFKLADDYIKSPSCQNSLEVVPEGKFLAEVITPLYQFLRNQQYEKIDGKFVKRERDHAQTVGYDDVNQLFWYPETIERIVLKDKRTYLHELPADERYLALRDVAWDSVFQKTYKERRTWLHVAVNFTRIWIIHVVAFYYYIFFNAPSLYLNADPAIAAKEESVQWSVIGLGGAIATAFMLVGAVAEYFFVPLTWKSTNVLTRRMILLVVVLVINVIPSIYVVLIDRTSPVSRILGIVQFFVGICTSIVFALVPSSRLFVRRSPNNRKTLASQTFTASFPKLKASDRAMSIGLWCCVFGCKLLESYFFLALSFKDPLKVMNAMRIYNCNDLVIGSTLCTYMPVITLCLMFFMDLTLFFLDTYLWYVIWNTVFSIARSFYLGISIWTPWRNIFSRLPKRIYAKILASVDMEVKYKPKVLCSQIWNAIIISMFREHLISIDHVHKLLYQQVLE